MRQFECQRECKECCCTRLLSKEDGKTFSIYLTPEETKLFPPETVFPLFRAGERIFAYQLGVERCPNLKEDAGKYTCAIYDRRPLICRAFPGEGLANGTMTVRFSACHYTAQYPKEEWDMTSFAECFQAVGEQMAQDRLNPQATEMFVLDEKRWVPL